MTEAITHAIQRWPWLPQVWQWLLGKIDVATILTAVAWLVKFFYQTYRQGFRGYQDMQKFTGDYDAYHYSSLNEPKIMCMRFKIRKKLFGGLTIFNSDPTFTYRGDVMKVSAQLHMYLPEKSGDEFLHYVLHAPLTGKPILLLGVFSAVTRTREPMAAKVLFQRRENKIQKNERDVLLNEEAVDARIVNFLQLKPGTEAHPNHILVVDEPREYSLDYLAKTSQ